MEQNQGTTTKATWLYPPVWISDISENEFNRRFPFNNQPIEESAIVVFNETCENHPFLIREDGFIAIGTEDTKLALDFFNTFAACAFMSKISLLAVTETEIQPLLIDFENSNVERESVIKSNIVIVTPYSLLHSNDTGTNRMLRYQGLMLVPKNKMAEIVSLVKKVFPKEEVRKKLVFFAQSLTHYVKGENSASFILSWTIVENYIDKLWEKLLCSREIQGNRRDSLTGRDWTINHKLQTMNLVNVLDNDKFQILDSLRKDRNDFVHDMEEIAKPQALECLKIVGNVIREEITTNDNT